MRSLNIEDALNNTPFVPFDIHVDGRVITVEHPDQALFNKAKTTLVVAPNEHIHVIAVEHISSITLRKRTRH